MLERDCNSCNSRKSLYSVVVEYTSKEHGPVLILDTFVGRPVKLDIMDTLDTVLHLRLMDPQHFGVWICLFLQGGRGLGEPMLIGP